MFLLSRLGNSILANLQVHISQNTKDCPPIALSEIRSAWQEVSLRQAMCLSNDAQTWRNQAWTFPCCSWSCLLPSLLDFKNPKTFRSATFSPISCFVPGSLHPTFNPLLGSSAGVDQHQKKHWTSLGQLVGNFTWILNGPEVEIFWWMVSTVVLHQRILFSSALTSSSPSLFGQAAKTFDKWPNQGWGTSLEPLRQKLLRQRPGSRAFPC